MGILLVFLLESDGGGVIQGTASEATLVALLSARAKAIDRIQAEQCSDRGNVMSKLVAYGSTVIEE